MFFFRVGVCNFSANFQRLILAVQLKAVLFKVLRFPGYKKIDIGA